MTERNPHGLFQKILDFFRQINEAFRPTAAGTFGRIESGEVWRRQPREVDVFGEPIRYKVDEENLRRGREAMEKVIAERTDVPAAMRRKDLGDISLYWGKPGDPKKDFEGGFGVSHIISLPRGTRKDRTEKRLPKRWWKSLPGGSCKTLWPT